MVTPTEKSGKNGGRPGVISQEQRKEIAFLYYDLRKTAAAIKEERFPQLEIGHIRMIAWRARNQPNKNDPGVNGAANTRPGLDLQSADQGQDTPAPNAGGTPQHSEDS